MLQKKDSMLQKKASQQSDQGVKDTGVRDLREKLSARMHSQPQSIDFPTAKLASEIIIPIKRSVPSVEAHGLEYRKFNPSSSPKKSQQKVLVSLLTFHAATEHIIYYC